MANLGAIRKIIIVSFDASVGDVAFNAVHRPHALDIGGPSILNSAAHACLHSHRAPREGN